MNIALTHDQTAALAHFAAMTKGTPESLVLQYIDGLVSQHRVHLREAMIPIADQILAAPAEKQQQAIAAAIQAIQ